MKLKDILKYSLWSLLALPVSLVGCSDDDPDPVFQSEKLVRNVLIPEYMEMYAGQQFEIQGRGYLTGDVLRFAAAQAALDIPVEEAGPTYARFTVPDRIEEVAYTITVHRGEASQLLGQTAVRFIRNTDVPDREGMNIKGMVYSGTEGLSGVWVSDGQRFAQTDDLGRYWLKSDKYHGYVFVCLPSGYQPQVSKAQPAFWSALYKDAAHCEQHDFRLTPVDNDRHTLVVLTDVHLANRNSPLDYKQFADGFMKDAAAFAAANAAAPIYGLNLGDLSWDGFWYKQSWALPECKEALAALPFALYSVMGNHDNDPRVAGDFPAEAPYKEQMGPSYYSMDIGKVHYIMLDNNVYLNPGASEDDRSYDKFVIPSQMEWLKEDLSHVDRQTPIVVGLHCPVYTIGNLLGNFVLYRAFSDGGSSSGSSELAACFKGFEQVHIVSGHSHINRTTPLSANGVTGADYMIEHNIAAVCGTWWWTAQYAGNNICRDGSPDGYKVFEIDGTNVAWYYKGVGLDRSKQFRTYDMNEVKKYWASDAQIAAMGAKYPDRLKDYNSVGDNEVLINLWGYEPFGKEGWTISVTENGTPLETRSVWLRDPLHTVSYDAPRTAKSGSYTKEFASVESSHMLLVKTSSATSALEITVTDKFGNTSTETMTRPKRFSNQAIN